MRAKGKKTIKEEQRIFRCDVAPVIGSKFIDEVTRNDIEQIQTRILKRAKARTNASREGKVSVKHAVACTRRLFDLAIRKEKRSDNPVKDIDSLGITGKRDRVLSFKEIWLFWNGLEKTGTPPVTIAALRFELVTMQRSVEIRHLMHKSLKLDEGVWQMEMHQTKNRQMHRVPLNRHALTLIREVKPYTEASPYVFGATRARKAPRKPQKSLGPLGTTALAQAVRRSRGALGIENICPHDLRRTGATWITAVGLPKLYARLMLNHSDGDRDVTGEVYVQYSYDFEKRRAAEVWAFVLDQIITAPSVEDVPTLDDLRQRVKESGLL